MKQLLLLLFVLTFTSTFSQTYQIKISSRQAGYSSMVIDEATITADAITLHGRHHSKYNTRTLEIPATTKLYIPQWYSSLSITNIIGASFGTNTFKSGRKYDISFVSKVDWEEIMDYLTNPLFSHYTIGMQLTTNLDFQQDYPRYGYSEWRYDFTLPLTYEQQLALMGGSYLNRLLTKNEFETTNQYKERTQADSLKLALLKKMKRLATQLHLNETYSLERYTPTLVYHADSETYTVNISPWRIQPIKINVPLAEAKGLKDQFTAGKLKIKLGKTTIASNGTLIAHTISFVESKSTGTPKGQTFENILSAQQSEEETSIVDKAFQEIVKKNPNGKYLK